LSRPLQPPLIIAVMQATASRLLALMIDIGCVVPVGPAMPEERIPAVFEHELTADGRPLSRVCSVPISPPSGFAVLDESGRTDRLSLLSISRLARTPGASGRLSTRPQPRSNPPGARKGRTGTPCSHPRRRHARIRRVERAGWSGLASFVPDLEPQRRTGREFASRDARRPLQLGPDHPEYLDSPAVPGARGIALDPVALPSRIE
jgi:hypothetical protein